MKFWDATPAGLCEELKRRVIKTLTPSLWQINEYSGNPGEDDYTSPNVHVQYVPQKILAESTGAPDAEGKPTDAGRDKTLDRPLVRIFVAEGRFKTFDAIQHDVKLVFEGWWDGKDNQGWRIPMIMMWAVIAELCRSRNMGAFRIASNDKGEPAISYAFPDEAAPPYWRGELDVSYVGAPPAQMDVDAFVRHELAEPLKFNMAGG